MVDKVSIIVPIFNSQDFLGKCIESIQNQSYRHLEIILINDGSSDDSERIAKSYAREDSRIVYQHITNSGVSVARNTGLSLATSEYIMFVDSDDIIESDSVEKLMNAIETADFAMCGYYLFRQSIGIIKENKCPSFSGAAQFFGTYFFEYTDPPFLLSPCFKIFRRSIIRDNRIGFPLNLSYGEDAVFVLQYLRNIKSIVCIPDMGYGYRQHGAESLNTKFRADKIDINYTIHEQIEQVAAQFGNTEADALADAWLVGRFFSYCSELIACRLSYQEKKTLLLKKETEYGFCFYLERLPRLNLPKTILLFSLKSKIFLLAYLLFRIYNLKENRRQRKNIQSNMDKQ